MGCAHSAPDLNVIEMKILSLTSLASIFLLGSLSAVAPDHWIRTEEARTIKTDTEELIHHGAWQSADSTVTVIVVNVGPVKTTKDLRERGAGMMSGVMRSGIFPLAFESSSDPHPTLILRGQAEHQGIEYFQDTYAVLTQSGLMMIKVSGMKKEIPFEISEWDLGSAVMDKEKLYLEEMKGLTTNLNKEIVKFRDLVTGARNAKK